MFTAQYMRRSITMRCRCEVIAQKLMLHWTLKDHATLHLPWHSYWRRVVTFVNQHAGDQAFADRTASCDSAFEAACIRRGLCHVLRRRRVWMSARLRSPRCGIQPERQHHPGQAASLILWHFHTDLCGVRFAKIIYHWNSFKPSHGDCVLLCASVHICLWSQLGSTQFSKCLTSLNVIWVHPAPGNIEGQMLCCRGVVKRSRRWKWWICCIMIFQLMGKSWASYHGKHTHMEGANMISHALCCTRMGMLCMDLVSETHEIYIFHLIAGIEFHTHLHTLKKKE